MSGWTPGDTAATIVGGLGLVGGVIGFVRSHFASKRADRATADAATARREAADAPVSRPRPRPNQPPR